MANTKKLGLIVFIILVLLALIVTPIVPRKAKVIYNVQGSVIASEPDYYHNVYGTLYIRQGNEWTIMKKKYAIIVKYAMISVYNVNDKF